MTFPLLTLIAFTLLSLSFGSDVCKSNPTIYRFSHGKIHGTIVSDGPLILNVTDFNVNPAAIRRSYRAAFRATTPILVSQNVVVLDVPDIGRVIVDTGSLNIKTLFPFARKAGRLFENLQAAGIPPESIDAIFITHGHIDHVGGLLGSEGRPSFPNATLYIGKKEHEYWSDPTPNTNSMLPNDLLASLSDFYKASIAPYASRPGRLVLVPDNGSPFPGVRFLLGPGHSPGHNAIQFTSGGKRFVVSGDTWVTRFDVSRIFSVVAAAQPDQVQNPEWQFSSESDTFDAYDSRIKLMNRLAKRRDLVLSFHEQFPGLGFVSQAGHLFDWVPSAPQQLGIGVSTQC